MSTKDWLCLDARSERKFRVCFYIFVFGLFLQWLADLKIGLGGWLIACFHAEKNQTEKRKLNHSWKVRGICWMSWQIEDRLII